MEFNDDHANTDRMPLNLNGSDTKELGVSSSMGSGQSGSSYVDDSYPSNHALEQGAGGRGPYHLETGHHYLMYQQRGDTALPHSSCCTMRKQHPMSVQFAEPPRELDDSAETNSLPDNPDTAAIPDFDNKNAGFIYGTLRQGLYFI